MLHKSARSALKAAGGSLSMKELSKTLSVSVEQIRGLLHELPSRFEVSGQIVFLAGPKRDADGATAAAAAAAAENAAEEGVAEASHVVILGDGNLSYSCLQVSRPFPTPRFLTCTTYDSAATVVSKYGLEASTNISLLSSLSSSSLPKKKAPSLLGVALLHGVDATSLSSTLVPALSPLYPPISSFEFHFPHSGTKSNSANRALLTGYLRSASELMATAACTEDCELKVTVKTTPKYNAWTGGDLRAIGIAEGLILLRVDRPDFLGDGSGECSDPSSARVSPDLAGGGAPDYKHATTKRMNAAASSAATIPASSAGVEASHVDVTPSLTWTFRAEDSLPVGYKCRVPQKYLALLSRLPDDYCDLCNKTFSSAFDLEAHRTGAGHRKVVQDVRRKERFKKKKDKEEEAKRRKSTMERTGVLYDVRTCKICGVGTNGPAAWSMHVEGKRHKENEKRKKDEMENSKKESRNKKNNKRIEDERKNGGDDDADQLQSEGSKKPSQKKRKIRSED